MQKFLCIPDSFKGTMSSSEICDIMREAILGRYPDAEVVKIPLADGGEGSVDAFLSAVGGEKRFVAVSGPHFEEIEAFYGLIDHRRTAVIEMAACAGLPIAGDKSDPRLTTTYGVGQLMADAIQQGCNKIILGLGGSATNDAGAGAACALGIKFINYESQEFVPVGGTLKDISHIDTSKMLSELRETEIITMCDIDNPMYGETGAAYIFGPQKGATPEIVIELDNGLKHIAKIIKTDLGKDVSLLPGSGAAGGMGAGMMAFFDSKLQMGIETILNTVKFDQLLHDADLIFTGEGRIDRQSLGGKVVIGISRRARLHKVPVVAIVGDIGDNIEAAYDEGVSAIFSINRVAVEFGTAKLRAKSDLALTMENIMGFIQLLERRIDKSEMTGVQMDKVFFQPRRCPLF